MSSEQKPAPYSEAGPIGFVAGFCGSMGVFIGERTIELVNRGTLDRPQTLGVCLAAVALTITSGLSWQEFHQIRDGKSNS